MLLDRVQTGAHPPAGRSTLRPPTYYAALHVVCCTL